MVNARHLLAKWLMYERAREDILTRALVMGRATYMVLLSLFFNVLACFFSLRVNNGH